MQPMIVKPKHFMKTVTTAGTRQQLTSANIHVGSAVLQAEISNTGYVYIGNETVSSTDYFALLVAGASTSLDSLKLGLADAKIDLSSVWLDVSVSTDGVSCGYFE